MSLDPTARVHVPYWDGTAWTCWCGFETAGDLPARLHYGTSPTQMCDHGYPGGVNCPRCDPR